ncbi:GGDEF domain-containing protein [Modestobacter italicus]|uniref:GGDEF domain-containing protein n=1 Tax=Modestobacter italicus (strain DSM 44449 / CECT 9708 / BC 501) TaxID=2732864 RepID=UPI001C94C9D8|nr:GGDEF domain-containing protein [Modestobacter italicus]
MTAGPDVLDELQLETARWRLLAASAAEEAQLFTDELACIAGPLATTGRPCWDAWSAAFTARAALFDGDPDTADAGVAAARAALELCAPTAERALVLAYLAHLEVTADRFDAALHLAVDASLLADQVAAEDPSRELHQAHAWLSLALTGLDLEELAVAQSLRGARVASALPDLGDQWQLLRLCAQQHAELAQTVHRRGDTTRSRDLAQVAVQCATAARALPWEPAETDTDLLDVVQAWAMTLSGQLDEALPPLRRVRRHLASGQGSTWLMGYADLLLARLLTLRCARDDDPGRPQGEEAVGLLVSASGAFAAVGDRRRYRQCLLELGQATAAMGSTGEALHWLEAYRHETTRAHRRSRELWAEMFVRRSRLREAQRQTAVLRRHALEDALTGLGNRRSAERRMGELRLDREPVSLAVVDVDGFKAVNDENSHLHGDAVLRRVAELLRQHSRTGDEVFRWAGDEFVVVLPNTGEARAVVAMERLRSAVAGADWTALGLPAPVTVSIGVASAGPAGPAGARTWRELFDAADLHLFGAKRAGRDQVRATGGGQLAPAPAPRSAGLLADASVDELVAEVLGSAPRRPGWAFEDGEVTS